MKKLFLFALAPVLISCGGGGGGGSSDSNYEGDVTLDLERDDLDSGDLTRVTVEVNNLNRNGAILKIRSSKSLRYVKNSAVRMPDRDEEARITPEQASTSDSRYAVFFLYPDDAIGGSFISVQFQMKATSGDKDAFIQVDLDNNDPTIADSSEFKASDPRFSPLLERGLYIAPDANEPTPTPVPSGTVSATPTTTR